MKPLVNSYFSGCGGLDLGLLQAGLQVQQSLEIDRACAKVLGKNFDHAVLQCDITTRTVLEQKRAHVIAGTYPCTKYSPIADIHGTRTGDDLFLHFFRHIAIMQPDVYVVENVPGMKKFPVVMEAMKQLPNYYVTEFCPVDAIQWLPQKRARLIIIGTKEPFRINPPSCRRRMSIRSVLEKSPNYTLPQYFRNRFTGKYRDNPIIVDPGEPGAFAPTCVAHYSKDKSTRVVKDDRSPIGVRPFTPREYARLQGFPDDFELPNNGSAYRMVGNAVPVPMGRWIGQELMRYFN